jgi:hypothetical protein
VIVDRVDAEADDLHVALVELALQLGDRTQFRRAHGREIARMRKEHGPFPLLPRVEVEAPFGCLRREVRGFVAQSNRHWIVLLNPSLVQR